MAGAGLFFQPNAILSVRGDLQRASLVRKRHDIIRCLVTLNCFKINYISSTVVVVQW